MVKLVVGNKWSVNKIIDIASPYWPAVSMFWSSTEKKNVTIYSAASPNIFLF